MAPHLPDHCWKAYYLNESCREEEDIMNHDDQYWEEYLSRRPNLSKWIQCSEQDSSFDNRVLFMQYMIETGGETEYDRKVADLDDNEALAYFVYLGFDNSLLIDSKAVKHLHQPSISLEEASPVRRMMVPYIDLLCTRKLGGDFSSNELLDDRHFIDDLLQTIEHYSFYKFHHIVWDTEQDLVRTVIGYKNYRNLFKVDTDSEILIDSDFLNNYLLADKPEPIEIDRNTWHGMSFKLIEKLDDESDIGRVRLGHMNFLEFVFAGLVSCFLTRNLKDLTFMETIYDFCVFASNYPGFMDRNVRESYRPGKLDPKLFDMLREYGSAFVEPLLENALIMKGERTS